MVPNKVASDIFCFTVQHYIVFSDGVLQTLVVSSAYLMCCCLSMVSRFSILTCQPILTSDPWPTSHWVFSYSGTLLCTSVNATDSCTTIKIPINQQFVKDSNICSKSLQYLFFPILLLTLRFSKSSSPHTHLNALIFNHVIGLLAICVNKQFNISLKWPDSVNIRAKVFFLHSWIHIMHEISMTAKQTHYL